jgi:hypothetical protein
MMEIRTNHQYRNLIFGYELTAKEREDFDYIDADDFDSHDFLRYRGNLYDVHEFECSNVDGWDGQFCDSFFSAILIKYEDGDMNRVKVGLALS